MATRGGGSHRRILRRAIDSPGAVVEQAGVCATYVRALIIRSVSTKQRRVDRGTLQARHLLRALGNELRAARQAAGLSQEVLGRAVGISGAHVARLERSAVPGASVALFSRLFAVLGMRLSARPFPDGPPLRDVAHVRLLTRLHSQLPVGTAFRTEVPLRASDLRAWDAEIENAAGICRVEAETVLADVQAMERRIALKMADDHVGVVILLVADTRRNRLALVESRELLRARFPLDTRAVMGSLRRGRMPRASGIVRL